MKTTWMYEWYKRKGYYDCFKDMNDIDVWLKKKLI